MTGAGEPRRVALVAWAIIGIIVLLAATGLVLRELSVVVVPLLLAFFPATLLAPLTRILQAWHLPRSLAALVSVLVALILVFGAFAAVTKMVVDELPELVESAEGGVDRVEEMVGRFIPGFEIPAMDEIGEMIRERLGGAGEEGAGADSGSGASELASRGLSVASSAVEFLTGLLLLIVVLFFYLQGGQPLADRFVGFVAPGSRERIMVFANEAWRTLGDYFRGQLLVALVDAVLIGAGLLLLGIPLALPLAVLVFFGGLFPIIGAIASGALAVLVAFSDGGLGSGLAVAGLVLAVQQLESNVLEPYILGKAIKLHPLAVILSISAGAILIGVLGAFLAVPVAAITQQVILRLREERHGRLLTAATAPAGSEPASPST